MKAKLILQCACPGCGTAMRSDGETICCTLKSCSYYDIPWRVPTIDLEPVRCVPVPDELARLRAEAECALDGLDGWDHFVEEGEVDPIRAYIAALEAKVAALDGWRPVTETDPAEGLEVQVQDRRWTIAARYISREGCEEWRDDRPEIIPRPTHYRPLPEPPVKP